MTDQQLIWWCQVFNVASEHGGVDPWWKRSDCEQERDHGHGECGWRGLIPLKGLQVSEADLTA